MNRITTLYLGTDIKNISKTKKTIEAIKASTILLSLGCVIEFGLAPTTHIVRQVLSFGMWG